jgi:hypothetical protein
MWLDQNPMTWEKPVTRALGRVFHRVRFKNSAFSMKYLFYYKIR